MTLNFPTDETHQDILIALIHRLLTGGEKFSMDALEKVVERYHQDQTPVGYDQFFKLPTIYWQLSELASKAILKGLREGKLTLSAQ